jgi:hypothetical protein
MAVAMNQDAAPHPPVSPTPIVALPETAGGLKPRPDASSLREAALRSMKRRAKAAHPEPNALAHSQAASESLGRAEVASDAMDLDYGDASAPTGRVTTPGVDKEDGEMEEGEISDDETQEVTSVDVLSSRFRPNGMVVDDPLPASGPTVVLPVLNLAHFGVDEKHVRPGLNSTFSLYMFLVIC